MPKVRCPCGYLHNLSPIPDDGWLTIRDRDHDALTPDATTPPEERLAIWQELIRRGGHIYECPQCNRLMWTSPGEGVFYRFRIYRLESDTGEPAGSV